MSIDPHPRAQLSAYLDDALSAVERSAVDAHLDACADCRARLGELRATASLIRSLPDIAPRRSLVPRIATVPAWLAPLRTLTTLASGISAFLFIASALVANMGGQLTSFSSAGAPAASAGFERNAAAGAAQSAATSAPPAPAVADASKALAPSPAPSTTSQFSAVSTTTPPQDAASRTDNVAGQAEHAVTPTAPQIGPNPWTWLGLTIVFGAIAFALQRRLRSA